MKPEAILKALADETRQRTVMLLTGHELSVSELVEILALPQSTVSRHLKVLRSVGLISDRREGHAVLCSAHDVSNGHPGQLSSRLLEWVAQEPLPEALAARRQTVIDRRRDMSRRFFDRVGRRWDALREDAFGRTFHLEAFLALLPVNWTVLDVGTGTGYLLPTLMRQFERVIGVDPVERMLQVARSRVEQAGLGPAELYRGDLARLPIKKETVDLALAVLVLHHVPTPRDAAAELHRILRCGGQLLIVEQKAHTDEAFRERMQDPWWGFEPDAFRTLLESVGFEEVCLRTLPSADRAPDAPELLVVTGRKT